jgi:hypothetical protein
VSFVVTTVELPHKENMRHERRGQGLATSYNGWGSSSPAVLPLAALLLCEFAQLTAGRDSREDCDNAQTSQAGRLSIKPQSWDPGPLKQPKTPTQRDAYSDQNVGGDTGQVSGMGCQYFTEPPSGQRRCSGSLSCLTCRLPQSPSLFRDRGDVLSREAQRHWIMRVTQSHRGASDG